MPFLSVTAGISRPFELPPRQQAGVERVANAAPLRPVASGEHPDGPVVRSLRAYRAQSEAAASGGRHPATTARDLMTSPVETLPGDASVAAARALIRLRGFRHVPVVSPHGETVGMLSDRDLFGETAENCDLVGDLMRTEVLVATPDTHVRDLARVMVHAKVSALPIVGGDRTLVGIVTTTDLLDAIVNEAPVELWT